MSFGARLAAAIAERGNLCAGIDPHPSLLEQWGLTDDVAGLREFSRRSLDAFADTAAVVKPQSAFFERHGSGGAAVLEQLLDDARSAGALTILDVKRGDIGSTMAAYADAYLGEESPYRPDAITVSPYLGFESLRPAIDAAATTGRGVFVLCLTSNPEGAEVQLAERDGVSVAAGIARQAAAENAAADGVGSVGLVVGSTVGRAVLASGIDLGAVNGPFLVPGAGAQGGDLNALGRVFRDVADRVVVSSSRELLSVGPDVAVLRGHAGVTRDRIGGGLRLRRD